MIDIFEKIENLICKDEDLLYLYQNDSVFHNTIETAMNNKMSIKNTLIFTLLEGYKAKRDVENDYSNYIQNMQIGRNS